MADIGEAIHSRLIGNEAVANLVSDRVYPHTPVEASVRPYITYHLISMLPRPHAMGADPPLATDRYQVDLWADTYSDVVELGDAVMGALSRWRGTELGIVVQDSYHVDRRDFYESDVDLRRRSLDFEISWEES